MNLFIQAYKHNDLEYLFINNGWHCIEETAETFMHKMKKRTRFLLLTAILTQVHSDLASSLELFSAAPVLRVAAHRCCYQTKAQLAWVV